VENAIYEDPRVMEVAAVGVPDRRLGEQVAVIVTLKPAFREKVKPEDLIKLARKRWRSFIVNRSFTF
jgi:acyl-CoA synthetase (AMP-forming)/AMP-acid ligase II